MARAEYGAAKQPITNMIRISQKDFESLKGSTDYDGLHEYLTRISRNGKGDVVWSPSDGTIYIKNESLGTAFRNLLGEWTKNANIEVVQVPSASATPAPVLKEDGLARLQREQREAEEATEKARLEAANKRLAALINEDGLLDIDSNVKLLTDWFNRNPSVPYNAYNLNIAVEQLAAELTWAVWSKRMQPLENVRMLENGEPELLIDCDSTAMQKASIVQLRDLSKRRG